MKSGSQTSFNVVTTMNLLDRAVQGHGNGISSTASALPMNANDPSSVSNLMRSHSPSSIQHVRQSLSKLIEKYSAPESDNADSGTNSSSSSSSSRVRPFNYDDFVGRLKSFSLASKWFCKADIISPIECARFGWSNIDYNVLACTNCGIRLTHNAGLYNVHYNIYI